MADSATYKIRLGEERRKLWDQAAKASRRTLADFIKVTVDAEAKNVLQGARDAR